MTALRIRRREAAACGEWPVDYPDLLRRLYAARGAQGPAQARPRLADLPPPDAMPGIDAACTLLDEAISNDRRIVVVADFAGKDGYLAYRDHPAHRAVVEEFIAPIAAERAAIQYET